MPFKESSLPVSGARQRNVMFLGEAIWMPRRESSAMKCFVLSGPGVYVM
jgi:hypothetical protein